jgi:tetratricopeptide (TPR) repeat protein
LKNPERARENLYKSLEINKTHKNLEGLLADYKDLARSTDNPLFIDSLLTVAEKLEKDQFILSETYRLNGKNMRLAYHTVITANSQVALHYLKANSDLDFYVHNLGAPPYYLTLGNIYFYAKQFDSSLHYYKLGEPQLVQSFETSTYARIYRNIGMSYQNLNQPQEAIRYFQKALAYNRNDVDVLLNLSKLFADISDYKNAYTYNTIYDQQMDTIRKLNNQREIDLLEVEQANRQRQKELDAIAAEQVRRNNLQYTGISFGIAFLFVGMLIFGMFPVSRLAIRMVNFFSFICLFEFIILLIDNWLHHQTHGEPLKIWVAKIFIIAILLPLHHTLEHLGLKFMDSQKLIRLRERIKFRRFWKPSKKTIGNIEKNLEESTLV